MASFRYTACLNNLAAVFLGQKEYYKAREALVCLLEVDGGNIKALVRAARASMGLCEYTEATACLDRALEIAPGHPAVAQERARLAACKREYRQRSKAMQRNMSKSFQEAGCAPSSAAHSMW